VSAGRSQAASGSPPERVAILIYDGFDELDAIGPYEVLRNAARGGADLAVKLVTLEPSERVTANHGLAVVPQGTLDHSYDMVIVPGGGWADRAPVGAFAEARRERLPAALREARERGAAMASVCTGAMLLSAAGLTTGRRATTHASALEELAAAGAEVVRGRVVDDGDLITAGGVTAGIDLALWVVERDHGAELADAIAREMEHTRGGDVDRGGA
jgi:transcriptional regulator GlxA family with amidase domain